MTTRWLTRHQAADYMGCSVATIDRWASSGRITRKKVDDTRSTRFDVNELDQLIKDEK